jgi:Ca2+/Na+ antiporter
LARGCGIYIVAVGALLAVTFDGIVEWYEALILVLMYIAYFILMWKNGIITKLAKKVAAKLTGSKTVLNDPGKLVFLVTVE